MYQTRCLSIGSIIAVTGAAVLLSAQNGSLSATADHPTVREFQLAAFGLDLNKIYPWAVGSGTPASSSGAAALSAVIDSATVRANGALQAVNQLGPLAFDLNSIRAFSASHAPLNPQQVVINYTNVDQWVIGLAGLANSTGALGFTDNAAAYDPFLADHAGVLQTANQVGPFVFDLNVLKAIGFFQAPSGTVLASGRPDNISAVDIGRWRVGIPGLITNTGTTGFVAYQDFGDGSISQHWVGGLHTTTQVGSMTFDFKFFPAIGAGIIPPGISFSLAPDLTAANTPFAPSSPPPPGVVQPMGGLPTPAAIAAPVPVAAQTATAGDPVLADPVEETPQIQTTRINDTKPEAAIPGINGAPLTSTPKAGNTGVSGSTPIKPFRPFKTVTNMIKNGIETFTGNFTGKKPTTGAPGAEHATGDATGGGGPTGTGNDNG
jgi:hypothetical protein